MSEKKEELSFREASDRIQISTATLHNWERQNIFTAENGRISLKEFQRLKRSLENGKLGRLNKRANRSLSGHFYWPDELLDKRSNRKSLEDIASRFIQEGISAVQCAALVAAKLFGELYGSEFHPLSHAPDSVSRTFQDLSVSTGIDLQALHVSQAPWIRDISLPEEPEILGLLYQRLRSEGKRSRSGAFFTPLDMALSLVPAPGHPGSLFLDPSCGTGIFLSAALKKGWKLNQLRGLDLDAGSVFISRCRLLLESGEESLPAIEQGDFLFREFPETFDAVVTNPPWGCSWNNKQKIRLKKRFPDITSGESSSFFLARGLECLEPGGQLNYLLPESLLIVRRHRDIRAHILSRSLPLKCRSFGRRFKRVFSPVVSLSLKKETVPGDLSGHKLRIDMPGWNHVLPMKRILSEADYRIISGTDENDWTLLDKINSKADRPLRDIVKEWGMGIVTGDNSSFCSKTPAPGYDPLVQGRDISPFRIKSPSLFIRYDEERIQQTAGKDLYKSGCKMVYRFISRYPVVSVENQGHFLLNSVNFFIPDEQLFSPRILALLLNSHLYRYIYLKRFPGVKVLRGDMEELPLPVLTGKERDLLQSVYEKAVSDPGASGVQKAVYDLFHLTEEDIFRVEQSIHSTQRDR